MTWSVWNIIDMLQVLVLPGSAYFKVFREIVIVKYWYLAYLLSSEQTMLQCQSCLKYIPSDKLKEHKVKCVNK